MAWFDYTTGKTHFGAPSPVVGYPDWRWIDCGCCGGTEWGGESPRECGQCGGSGSLFLHAKSGVLADYPGGPIRGRLTEKEIHRELSRA